MTNRNFRAGQIVRDIALGITPGGTILLTRCLHKKNEYHGIKNGHMFVIRRSDEIAPLAKSSPRS